MAGFGGTEPSRGGGAAVGGDDGLGGTFGSADEPIAPEAPSFVEVYAQVFDPAGCIAGYCHGGTAGDLELGGADETHAALVGVQASLAVCGLTDLVVPGDPDSSILWRRVRPAELDGEAEPCAEKMPKGMDPLTDEQAQLVHDWIEGGALP
jgi:hypothetical protein